MKRLVAVCGQITAYLLSVFVIGRLGRALTRTR